jgi:MFS family permease
MQIVIIHIVPHADDVGIPAIIAAGILSVNAGFRILGNLTVGFVSEYLGSRRVMTGSLVFLTSSLVWLIFARDIPGFILFAVTFGVMSGAVIPLLTLVPAELFGLNNLGIISGAFLLAGTLGGSIGSPLAGFIYDVSRSYEVAFTTGAFVGLAAIILSVILLKLKHQGTSTSSV